MGNGESSSFVPVFLGVMVILIVFALIAAYFYKDPILQAFNIRRNQAPELMTYSITLRAFDEDKQQLFPNYKLLRDGIVQYSGKLSASKVTSIGNLQNATKYEFKAYDEGYYPSKVECKVNSECQATLTKKGLPTLTIAQLTPTYHRGLLYVTDGTIKEPVYCVAWTNMLTIESDLEEFPVHSTRQNNYDKCFFTNEQLTEGLHEFDIRLIDPSGNSKYKITLFDDCGLDSCIEPLTKEIDV